MVALSRFLCPCWAVVLVWLLGLSLVDCFFPEFPVTIKLSVAPAVGISILAITFHIFSLFGAGIKTGTVFLVILAIILLARSWSELLELVTSSVREKGDILRWAVPILIIVLVHWAVYTYPTDNVDNFFHATKIEYMLRYDTTYPPVVPIFNVLTYPAGYHSLASFVMILSGEEVIPKIMLELRLWAWAFLAMGIYALSYIWLGRKVANYTLLAMLGVNLLHYYLLVYIAPNFLGFYFFAVLLALFVKMGEKLDMKKYLILVLISVGAVLVHPYSYQNYVFVALVYLVLRLLSESLSVRRFIFLLKRAFILFVIPLFIHAVINPYVWFPSLAHVKLEYPWASSVSVVVSKLSVFRGKNPRDTWWYFELFTRWATVRNDNYLGVLFMILGGTYLVYKREFRRKGLSLVVFFAFVMFLILDRLTINVPVPFYSTAAIERMFLWLVPVFPLFVGAGLFWFGEIVSKPAVREISKKILYLSIVGAFFLIPAVGTAHDLLAAEANFYVRADNLEDFRWISINFPNVTVLNSCTLDSAQWMPFFEPQGNITVMFNSRIKRCRIWNMTPSKFAAKLLNESQILPGYIAYIDTNAPSLNPLDFFQKYRLLRVNGNNWIFDLSSLDTSMNEKTAALALRLCEDSIPGNTERYGKYFVYGFKKKYFGVRSMYLEGLEYAWMGGRKGIVGFAPCKDYRGLLIELYSFTEQAINVTVNGKPVLKDFELKAGENRLEIPVTLPEDRLTFVSLSVESGPLLIREIKLLADS
ncbi:hypothetical protein A3K92_05240 [Thermococcus gorgonarius]|uniref:Glycosyltransferase RgtA/B/C/D-like domain-containing protein n=2 Tax=Thermococcus gorgonarius TaxID=71997 RepID=A0A2Z2M5V4_THEGO|nr:hypothetical protein A3K92_05240 [Thermococcus gorgonarius]